MFWGAPGAAPIPVATDWQTVGFEFTASGDATNGTLHFRFGQQAGEVELRDITIDDRELRDWIVWPPAMAGAMQQALDMTVQYAKDRIAYGKPIGTFQVIQHYLAEMWTEISLAKRLVYHAAWLVEQGMPCTKEVAMAKARVSEVYAHQTRMGVQMHGGIGTTRDHDMGLYYRRAKQAVSLFGDPEVCR